MFRSGNRSDKKLHEKIEDQEQKIVRYENRLRGMFINYVHGLYHYLQFLRHYDKFKGRKRQEFIFSQVEKQVRIETWCV